MKTRVALIHCFILLVCFISCKKESGANNSGTGGNGTQLIRIQQGINPKTDTVFKLTYKDSNIASIFDSIFGGYTNLHDTLNTVYAGSMLQSAADAAGSIKASYIYDGNGLLTEIDANVYGENDKYLYTYTGNNVSQKTWYSDFGEGGTLVLYQTIEYTVADGNITEAKRYNASNTLMTDVTFTYTAQIHSAIFKQLALLDIGDFLGFNDFEGFDIGGCDTYFNADMMSGYTYGTTVAMFPDILNANQLPVKIIDTDGPDYIFTWQFSYR
jgi:hypothetical protein